MQLILIAVISLDGRITRPGEAGPGFASPEDQRWFRSVLREFDCAIMGRTTFESIGQEIPEENDPNRLRVVMTRNPAAYDSKTETGRVEFSGAAPEQLISDLRSRRYKRCALLGGGGIYRLFLNSGLVDAAWLTLEPVALGDGTPFTNGVMREARFKLTEIRRLSADTLLLNYHRPDGPAIPLLSP